MVARYPNDKRKLNAAIGSLAERIVVGTGFEANGFWHDQPRNILQFFCDLFARTFQDTKGRVDHRDSRCFDQLQAALEGALMCVRVADLVKNQGRFFRQAKPNLLDAVTKQHDGSNQCVWKRNSAVDRAASIEDVNQFTLVIQFDPYLALVINATDEQYQLIVGKISYPMLPGAGP